MSRVCGSAGGGTSTWDVVLDLCQTLPVLLMVFVQAAGSFAHCGSNRRSSRRLNEWDQPSGSPNHSHTLSSQLWNHLSEDDCTSYLCHHCSYQYQESVWMFLCLSSGTRIHNQRSTGRFLHSWRRLSHQLSWSTSNPPESAVLPWQPALQTNRQVMKVRRRRSLSSGCKHSPELRAHRAAAGRESIACIVFPLVNTSRSGALKQLEDELRGGRRVLTPPPASGQVLKLLLTQKNQSSSETIWDSVQVLYHHFIIESAGDTCTDVWGQKQTKGDPWPTWLLMNTNNTINE